MTTARKPSPHKVPYPTGRALFVVGPNYLANPFVMIAIRAHYMLFPILISEPLRFIDKSSYSGQSDYYAAMAAERERAGERQLEQLTKLRVALTQGCEVCVVVDSNVTEAQYSKIGAREETLIALMSLWNEFPDQMTFKTVNDPTDTIDHGMSDLTAADVPAF
jgi:hypothetical protein